MDDKVSHQKRAVIMDEIHELLNQIMELEGSSQAAHFAGEVPSVRRALATKYDELTAFDAQR